MKLLGKGLGLGFLMVAAAISGSKLATVVEHVGDRTSRGVLVNTGVWIKPAGKTLSMSTRPTAIIRVPGKEQIVVRTIKGLVLVDATTLKVLAEVELNGGASLNGLALSPDGRSVLTGNSGSLLWITSLSEKQFGTPTSLRIPATSVSGESYVSGIAPIAGTSQVLVSLNRDNAVAMVDVRSREIIKRFPVQVAPYDVALTADQKFAWVSCWSTRAEATGNSADSAGSKVPVDERGIGKGGVLVKLNIATGEIVRSVPTGSQPTQLLLHKGLLWATIAGSDELLAVDPISGEVKTKIGLNVSGKVGSAPGALCPDSTGNSLLVSLGGENLVVRYDLNRKRLTQEAHTGWYPGGLVSIGDSVLVASTKGIGSRSKPDTQKGHGVYDFTGLVSSLGSTDFGRIATSRPEDAKPRKDFAAVPVPERVGEASTIKHVVYIIKENRTYDQVFGDVPEGNGDKSLAIFGEEVTPNHHALAKQFALLDNFYCNGVLSADGHAWATEGNATIYYEHSFGGWTRSYPFGDDPLATSSTGYIWDNVLSHGKSFKNYGEFDYAGTKPARSHAAILDDFLAGKDDSQYTQNIGVARLRSVSHKGFPGWNMGIPDVARAKVFVEDLKQSDRLADFTIVYLPQDHTSGTSGGSPTPRAHIADNDAALGRVVEAISKSRFWKDTCIFVVEDDAQDGFDHIDGHRSPCLVISPYVKRGSIVSRFYSQTSVLRTMEHQLGIPPMNRMDGNAPLMSACFQKTPNYTPYTALAPRIDLREVNSRSNAKIDDPISLSRPDDADEDVLNLQIWRSVKGSEPYPKRAKR